MSTLTKRYVRQISVFLMVSLLVSMMLCLCTSKIVNADEIYSAFEDPSVAFEVYFVDAINGNDSNDGRSSDTPKKTVTNAAQVAKNNGHTNAEFVLMSGDSNSYYNVGSVVYNTAYRNYNFKFTGKYGDTVYPNTKVYLLSAGNDNISTTSSDIFHSNLYLDYVTITRKTTDDDPANSGLWCLNGYNLYIDSHCQTDDSSWTRGNVDDHGIELANWPNTTIVAGINGNGDSNNLPEGTGHTIVIKSGRYGRIVGVNRRNKYYSGSASNPFNENIVIDGSAELALVVGASTEQFACYANPNIVINGGYVYRLVGSSLGFPLTGTSSKTYQKHYGNTTITINGGTVEKVTGSALGRNTPYIAHYGDTVINVNGGTIGEIQGGGALGNTYGDITVNINGGIVTPINESNRPISGFGLLTNRSQPSTGNVYGAGSGGADYMDWSRISSLSDKTLGNVDGHVTVNISSGEVHGNVYGGGRGYDYQTNYGSSDFFNVAQVSNGTSVIISGDAHIWGDVHGGGDGSATSDSIAKVYPSTSVAINPQAVIIEGDVYGGGNYGLVDGTTSVFIAEGTVLNNVYGGSSNSVVTGDVDITIEANSNISGNVFGGGAGDSSDVLGNVNVSISSNVNIEGSVYGGGENGNVEGDITIDIGESSVIKNIYGGGELGDVFGNTNITVGAGTQVSGTIFGGGNSGNVGKIEDGVLSGGNTSIVINPNANVGTVIGGGNSGTVCGNTSISVNGPVNFSQTIEGSTVAIAGGGLNGETLGDVSITLNNVTIDGDVFDGGVGSDAAVYGNVDITIEDTTISDGNYFYVGGGSGSVYGDVNIDKDASDINFKVSGENSDRDDDSFNGWQLDGNGHREIKNSDDVFKLDPGNYLMTINWTGITIIFHSNGHGSGEMANQRIAVGVNTPLNSCSFETSLYFNGWSTSSSSTAVSYVDGGNIFYSEDNLADIELDASLGYVVHLYALWDDPRTSTTIIIPKVVILDGETCQGSYSVRFQSQTNTIGWTISVYPETNSFFMSSTNKDDVTASIVQPITSWIICGTTDNPAHVGTPTLEEIHSGVTTRGTITANGLSAGSWSGTFNFVIDVIVDDS